MSHDHAAGAVLTVQHYDEMKAGVEKPDDPKPVSADAMSARKRAIREGRLTAVPRDETPRIAHPCCPPPATPPRRVRRPVPTAEATQAPAPAAPADPVAPTPATPAQ
jgi:hypothetical protein